MLRCQRGLPAGGIAKTLDCPAWQAAVRQAESLEALRSLLGEVGPDKQARIGGLKT